MKIFERGGKLDKKLDKNYPIKCPRFLSGFEFLGARVSSQRAVALLAFFACVCGKWVNDGRGKIR